MEQLPISVKKLWRVGGIFTGFVLGLIPAAVVVTGVVAFDWSRSLFALAAVPVVAAMAVGFWWAGVKFRNWGWQISDRWIEAKHGVLGHHRVVIPRNRVQTVTTNSGPIDRMLDLETITVHTAGAGAPNLTIPHLATATVSTIRRELGQGVNEPGSEPAPITVAPAVEPALSVPPATDALPREPNMPPPAAPPPMPGPAGE